MEWLIDQQDTQQNTQLNKENAREEKFHDFARFFMWMPKNMVVFKLEIT